MYGSVIFDQVKCVFSGGGGGGRSGERGGNDEYQAKRTREN